MQIISTANPTIYAGFHDETLPNPAGLAEGTLFVFLNTPLQTMIVRGSNWTFQENTPLTIAIPYGGVEGAQETVLAGPTGTVGGTVNRPVVVLGNTTNATEPSEIEKALIKLLDLNIQILTELRILNLQFHEFAANLPIEDDLDVVRVSLSSQVGVLDPSENITR